MIILYVVNVFKIMRLSLLLMLATIMSEEEISALFIFPCHLKCKLLIICIIYH
jgi:hypothetical protein